MNARVSYSFQRFPYVACPARSRGNPKISLWLSVDPLAEKYPGMSPYNYTAENPINLVDPDGRAVDGPPLKRMFIRRNRASNLGPGYVRNNGTRFHAGHDLYAPIGTPVLAVFKGKVIKVGHSSSYGNYITIEHNIEIKHSYTLSDGQTYNWSTYEKRYSFYAHLSATNVKEGDNVEMGQIIGKVGNSGNAKNLKGKDIHLHFEWGEELRKGSSKMLKKDALRDPNEAYQTVRFESMDPHGNQTFTGIIKTEYQEFKGEKIEIKFYYNVNEEIPQ